MRRCVGPTYLGRDGPTGGRADFDSFAIYHENSGLLSHKDVVTTMICMHFLNCDVRSQPDVSRTRRVNADVRRNGMKRTYTITIAVLAYLLPSGVRCVRGQGSRKLILKRIGLPLANLKADVLPNGGTTTVIRTSTDLNGRLDLREVPEGNADDRHYVVGKVPVLSSTGTSTFPHAVRALIHFRGSVEHPHNEEDVRVRTVQTHGTAGSRRDTTRPGAPLKAEVEQPLPVDRARRPVRIRPAPGN